MVYATLPRTGHTVQAVLHPHAVRLP